MTIFETFICHFYLCLARRNTNNALTCAITLKHLSYVLESNIKKKKRFASQVKHNYVTGLDENIFIDMFFSFPSKDIKGNPVSISIQNRGS